MHRKEYRQTNKRLLILPAISVVYFLFSVVILLCIALLIDRVLIPDLEDKGKIVGLGWRADDKRIRELMKSRNHADAVNPVWRSVSFPVAEKHPGRKRILVMGDSYVWGTGAANMNDIWWRQLALELERRGYQDLDVVAAGLPCASTRNELYWAKQLVDRYQADMIVWGYVTNDPDEESEIVENGVSGGYESKAWPSLEDEEAAALKHIFILSDLCPELHKQLAYIRWVRYMNQLNKGKELEYNYDYDTWLNKLLEGRNFASYAQTVKRLAKFVDDSKIPSTVVTLCMPTDRSKLEPVQKLFKSAGLDFHNLVNAMIPWYKRLQDHRLVTGKLALAINPDNGHPGVIATHFYACETADILEKSFPQVLGERSSLSDRNNSGPVKINDYVPEELGVKNPKPNVFEILYPTQDKLFLHMPMRRKYVQLNLAKPFVLNEIRITGQNLKSCALAVRSKLKAVSDYIVAVHNLGSEDGHHCTFKLGTDLSSAELDEVMVTADFDGPNRILSLELVR